MSQVSEQEIPTLADPSCASVGMIGAARSWLADALLAGEECYKDHQVLLHKLAYYFTGPRTPEGDREIAILEENGFLVGYDRTKSQVTISNGAVIMSGNIRRK
jgi:hypothetical protein